MIDLHTHILPQMDDGADSCETSLEMLRRQAAQGVDTVALTPHYYPERESVSSFSDRRRQSFEMLCAAIEAQPADAPPLPELILGAEVAWTPQLCEQDGLCTLCYENTHVMLLELPFTAWSGEMLRRICDFQNLYGIIPVIAHLERYFPFQTEARLHALQQLGFPIQIGSDSLYPVFGRGKMLKMLRTHQAQLVASDCHNLQNRAPNLAGAMQLVAKKLGAETAQYLDEQARQLLSV